MATGTTPDTHTDLIPTIDRPALTVTQPDKIASLLEVLGTIDQMSERLGEDRSGDLGGGGGGKATGGKSGSQAKLPSPRDLAIANLPVAAVMQEKLTKKIEQEVHKLQRQIRTNPSASTPGSAHKLNKLFAKIRRLNSLLGEILEASFDVLRRIFIRVFIDEQPIL
ncbi:MAG: hypothetical protein WCG83_05180 [Candidatus Peregrinibacteria bacterium]